MFGGATTSTAQSPNKIALLRADLYDYDTPRSAGARRRYAADHAEVVEVVANLHVRLGAAARLGRDANIRLGNKEVDIPHNNNLLV